MGCVLHFLSRTFNTALTHCTNPSITMTLLLIPLELIISQKPGLVSFSFTHMFPTASFTCACRPEPDTVELQAPSRALHGPWPPCPPAQDHTTGNSTPSNSPRNHSRRYRTSPAGPSAVSSWGSSASRSRRLHKRANTVCMVSPTVTLGRFMGVSRRCVRNNKTYRTVTIRVVLHVPTRPQPVVRLPERQARQPEGHAA